MIELKGLQFYAYHGVYESEKTMGGNFETDVIIKLQSVSISVQHLNETIDYVEVYNVIKKNMQCPTPLLETLATKIASEILTTFNLAEEVTIRIKKMQPPVVAFTGEICISFVLHRNMLPG